MAEAEKAVLRRLVDEVWNSGRLEVIDELIAEEHVDHDPERAGLPGGRTGMRGFVLMYRAAFPDIRVELGPVIAEGDLVAANWIATGTHLGELRGIPPSGKAIEVTGTLIDRIVDGKIVESWTHWDSLGMLRQIGAAPEP